MKHYLTTPIYYASGSPHLGHACTTFVAEFYRRYHEQRGHDAWLVTGTDEHGQKIERTAREKGEDIPGFVEKRSREFRELWRSLGIGIDGFERTTSESHRLVVGEIWRRINGHGDLYKGHYSGLYCVECEQYFTQGTQCPVHRRPLERFSEESWFFRLGRYRQRLIDHIEARPDFILPVARRNEVLSFLRGNALHDLSVSRTSTRWGIPVPDDDDHVIYVWVDALAAYLSALGPLDGEKFRQFWPRTTHFIGKDILLFHAVYWPALLWSAGLELPRHIVVNGWLTVEGRKISKSDPETIIDPLSLARETGSDPLQYYFLKSVNPGQDLDFRRERLVSTLNADLANNIGNLFSRYITLFLKRYPDGIETGSFGQEAAGSALLAAVSRQEDDFHQHVERFDVAGAARCFLEIASLVNTDFQQKEPWKADPDAGLEANFGIWHRCLETLTRVGSGFLPVHMERARTGLGLAGPLRAGEKPGRIRVSAIEPLFQRLDTSAFNGSGTDCPRAHRPG